MFKLIGFFLVLYVCYAAATGRVWAKAGIRARQILREETPGYFWMVVGTYTALSVALFTVF